MRDVGEGGRKWENGRRKGEFERFEILTCGYIRRPPVIGIILIVNTSRHWENSKLPLMFDCKQSKFTHALCIYSETVDAILYGTWGNTRPHYTKYIRTTIYKNTHTLKNPTQHVSNSTVRYPMTFLFIIPPNVEEHVTSVPISSSRGLTERARFRLMSKWKRNEERFRSVRTKKGASRTSYHEKDGWVASSKSRIGSIGRLGSAHSLRYGRAFFANNAPSRYPLAVCKNGAAREGDREMNCIRRDCTRPRPRAHAILARDRRLVMSSRDRHESADLHPDPGRPSVCAIAKYMSDDNVRQFNSNTSFSVQTITVFHIFSNWQGNISLWPMTGTIFCIPVMY